VIKTSREKGFESHLKNLAAARP